MKKILLKTLLGLVILAVGCEVLLQGYVLYESKKRSGALGNADEFNVENLKPNEPSVLNGKKILFLGSSVTEGAAAERQSFVELFEHLDGVEAIKEAKSGTTLVDSTSWLALIAFGNGESYIKRLNRIDTDTDIDCVVCQLSTNDASLKRPLGEISEDNDLASLDTKTITGAIEYVIGYSNETWNCPVVFYTGSYYDSHEYAAMVDRLHELQNKWDFEIIDLYTDKEFNDIDPDTYAFYMYDSIHPTKAGYIRWWMPKMEEELIRILSK